jgi:hypothetical protein
MVPAFRERGLKENRPRWASAAASLVEHFPGFNRLESRAEVIAVLLE